jgi:hypothetical protein
MATRSNIGVLQTDGTIHAVYCHNDGYPEGVGATLKAHYSKDPDNPWLANEKVEELMDLGNLSALGRTPEESIAYSRDRGDKNQEATVYRSLQDLFNDCQQYVYIYTVEGEWKCYDGSTKNELRF